MSTKSSRKRLARLFALDPRCRNCGRITRLPKDCNEGGTCSPPYMATIEHMISKIAMDERPRWGVLTLYCFECNQAKAAHDQKAERERLLADG